MSTATHIKQLVTRFCSLLFMLLWVYAATAKLLELEQFRVQMSQVAFLKPVAPLLVWTIPLVEYALASALVFKKTRVQGLLSSAVLMSLFTIYIAGMIHFSPQLPCSCGGIINTLTWQQHLLFNLGFTAMGITGVFLQRQLKT